MPPQLGRFDLEFASDRLRTFGSEYRDGGRPARYVLGGDALINESAVRRNASMFMQLLNRYGRLITVELPFSARVVLAKTNLRILGLGPRADLTARVQTRSAFGSIHREVAARRLIEALHRRRPIDPATGPRIPKMVKRGSTWFVEQQVSGRHATAFEANRFIALHLPTFYERTVRMRPYRGPTSMSALLAEARVHMPDAPAQPPEGLWPVALCSGDINPTNLLCADDGRFWMIDWESSRVMAIALDLARACVEIQGLIDVALEIIRRFTLQGGVAPELQLLLGLSHESLRHAQKLKWATGIAGKPLRLAFEANAQESQERCVAVIRELVRFIRTERS